MCIHNVYVHTSRQFWCRQQAQEAAAAAAGEAEQQRLLLEAQTQALTAAEQAARQGQQRSDRLAWRMARLQLGPARAAQLAVRSGSIQGPGQKAKAERLSPISALHACAWPHGKACLHGVADLPVQ